MPRKNSLISYIRHIEQSKARLDARGQTVMDQEIAKGLGSGSEAAWYAHSGSVEMANHFAQ